MEYLTLDTLADGIDAYVYAIDYDTYSLTYINKSAKESFPDINLGDRCFHIFFGTDTPCENCPMKVLRRSGGSYGGTKWIRRIEKWVQVQYNHLMLSDGSTICVATGVDVTPMQESLSNMERILNGIGAISYTVRPFDHRLTFFNSKLQKMLPEIKFGDLCYQALWNRQEPCEFCPLSNQESSGAPSSPHVYNEKLGGHLSIQMVQVTGSDGSDLAVVTGFNISRLIESEQRLRRVAFTDSLTGLPNRTAFMESLDKMLSDGSTGCLCLLNIKQFRRYNLLYGKKEGDELLCRLSQFLSAAYVRGRIYRVSGTKLGFLAAGEVETRLLHKIIDKAVTDFLGDWNNQNFDLYLDTAYVAIPDYAHKAEEGLYHAEYLLDQNSKKNGSMTAEFSGDEQQLLDRRSYIEDILHRGPESGKFSVYYQPIYDISSGVYSKCEALMRLYDEKVGWISPMEFIPMAEEGGYISELERFVLDEVCCFLSDRDRKGLYPMKVNINISAIEFSRKDFCDELISAIHRWNVCPQLIQLEITESVFINSTESVKSTMDVLIREGFSFAIDDFGTGYSSLNYIGTMPVECLKLDKSFMDMLVDSDAYRLIVTNIIDIAKGLHLSIVAEGIESEAQYELIKSLGSDFIQGFLFSKPLPREAFERFLEQQRFTCGDDVNRSLVPPPFSIKKTP